MNQKFLVIFVCEHGAAKSVLAAAYFNKLAVEANLASRAIARGTNPDSELSPKTLEGLCRDGLSPTETVPQKLTLADLESADLIISFCELPDEFQDKVMLEQWNDIPPVSEDYEKARNQIIAKLNKMMK